MGGAIGEGSAEAAGGAGWLKNGVEAIERGAEVAATGGETTLRAKRGVPVELAEVELGIKGVMVGWVLDGLRMPGGKVVVNRPKG